MVLYVVLMATIIVAVDFLFFRNRFWERLIVNIRNSLGVRSFLLEIPQASMNSPWASIATQFPGTGWHNKNAWFITRWVIFDRIGLD